MQQRFTAGRHKTWLAAATALVALILAGAACGRAPQPGVAGRYRLRPPDYNQGTNAPPAAVDYYLTLKEDGTVQLEEVQVGTGQATVSAQGTWKLDGDGLILEITHMYGKPLVPANAIRYRMVDGFPVATDVAVGTALDALEKTRFTIGAGERHPLVQTLHRRLAGISWLGFSDPNDDLYTEETRKAVVAFQESQGLYPNGEVNGATWVLLGNPQPPLPRPTPRPYPTPMADVPAALGFWGLPTHTADGHPIVYLTFDDGPSAYTQQMLDLLARYNALATFFVVGEEVERRPDVVRLELQGGHSVGNHTYDHSSLEGLSSEAFMAQVEQTKQAVINAAGDLLPPDGVRYLRPPYGITDANTQQYAANLGYDIFLWDIDTQDWRRPGASVISDYVLSNVFPGAIVLMHDGGGDVTQSVQALETVLSDLGAQGYAFHKISLP